MTVKDIIQQVESSLGRQSEKYMFRLINDGLKEIIQIIIMHGITMMIDLLL